MKRDQTIFSYLTKQFNKICPKSPLILFFNYFYPYLSNILAHQFKILEAWSQLLLVAKNRQGLKGTCVKGRAEEGFFPPEFSGRTTRSRVRLNTASKGREPCIWIVSSQPVRDSQLSHGCPRIRSDGFSRKSMEIGWTDAITGRYES